MVWNSSGLISLLLNTVILTGGENGTQVTQETSIFFYLSEKEEWNSALKPAKWVKILPVMPKSFVIFKVNSLCLKFPHLQDMTRGPVKDHRVKVLVPTPWFNSCNSHKLSPTKQHALIQVTFAT